MIRRFRRVALLLLLPLLGSVASQALPPGFVKSSLIPGFIGGPESIEFTPDGVMWLSQSGPGEGMKIYTWVNDTLSLAYDFGTTPSGERGIHAILVDPAYGTNHTIWVYYTVLSLPVHNRLSRFTVSNNTLTNETVVFEGPNVNSEVHNGGCLAFAGDGTIFLGMGEDTSGNAAQDPFNLRGKILHMHPDGSPVAGNPYFDGSQGHPLVWARGVRNPFRCSIQPGTDNLFFGDVGANTWEEINIGIAGANFGWSVYDGPDTQYPQPPPGYVFPTYLYPHNGETRAVIGGVHVPAGFGSYEGYYVFGEWWTGEIFMMELDAANNPVHVEVFDETGGQIVDFEFGPDGALYVAARGDVQNILRIEFVGGSNGQPKARTTIAPTGGLDPLSVALDGSASSDPDQDPLTFDWDLGDGTRASTPVVNKAYPLGVYDVVLNVDDGEFDDDSPRTRIVSGNRAPTGVITSPVPGLTFSGGDQFSYGGAASDPEDPSVPCSQFAWQILFHHNDHTHPFIGPELGNCGGSFQIPTFGEVSPDVYYEVRLTATDSGDPLGPEGKLSHVSSVDLLPVVSRMTFETIPPGLTVSLDGAPQVSGESVYGVAGITRTLDADAIQETGGFSFDWVSWSDSGAKQHAIATPPTNTTFTAGFACRDMLEIRDLRFDQLLLGQYRLTWTPLSTLCPSDPFETYRIYAAADPIPAVLGGDFPADPPFTLVGTSTVPEFTFIPGVNQNYFLVVGVELGGAEGAVGHYGR